MAQRGGFLIIFELTGSSFHPPGLIQFAPADRERFVLVVHCNCFVLLFICFVFVFVLTIDVVTNLLLPSSLSAFPSPTRRQASSAGPSGALRFLLGDPPWERFV